VRGFNITFIQVDTPLFNETIMCKHLPSVYVSQLHWGHSSEKGSTCCSWGDMKGAGRFHSFW
jgi:hypothetical protein